MPQHRQRACTRLMASPPLFDVIPVSDASRDPADWGEAPPGERAGRPAGGAAFPGRGCRRLDPFPAQCELGTSLLQARWSVTARKSAVVPLAGSENWNVVPDALVDATQIRPL